MVSVGLAVIAVAVGAAVNRRNRRTSKIASLERTVNELVLRGEAGDAERALPDLLPESVQPVPKQRVRRLSSLPPIAALLGLFAGLGRWLSPYLRKPAVAGVTTAAAVGAIVIPWLHGGHTTETAAPPVAEHTVTRTVPTTVIHTAAVPTTRRSTVAPAGSLDGSPSGNRDHGQAAPEPDDAGDAATAVGRMASVHTTGNPPPTQQEGTTTVTAPPSEQPSGDGQPPPAQPQQQCLLDLPVTVGPLDPLLGVLLLCH